MALTDDELSRWIAEKLEPKPKDPGGPPYVFTTNKSKTAFWQLLPYVPAVAHSLVATAPIEYHWYPADMVNDPVMTSLLLDTLAANDEWCCVDLHCDVPAKRWRCSVTRMSTDEHDEHKPAERSFATGERRGRAVAELFAMVHGLPPERLKG
jgi:hypothetical protein